MKNLAALWPPLAWMLAFVAAPTLIIAAYSFFTRDDFGRPAPALVLDAWRSALSRDHLALFGRSAWVAAASTALCLAIAYPVAYFIAGSGRWKNALLALVVLPFWTNFLARTTAMQLILVRLFGPEFHSPAAVIAGLVYSYLPFMVLPLYVSIEKVPKRLLEAAADLGASPARSFWSVTVPLTAPGIAAGCVLVFIPCFGAFVTPTLLGSPREQLLGAQIAVAYRANVPVASALSMTMMAAVLALLAIYYRVKRTDGIV